MKLSIFKGWLSYTTGWFGILLASQFLISSVSAHTFHEGLSSLSVNARSGNLEITHRFATHHLTNALAKLTHSNINPEAKEFEAQLKIYFSENFLLFKNGRKQQLNWIGINPGVHEIIVFQEIEGLKSLDQLTLVNNLLIDFFPRQVNRVNYQDVTQKGTLIFKQNEITHKIPSGGTTTD